MFRHHNFSGGLKSAPGPVAGNRVADLATDCETDACLFSVSLATRARTQLYDQSRGNPFSPGCGDLEKFRASLKAWQCRHEA